MDQSAVIRVMCPNLSCKRVLAVPAHARGKLVRCKSCGITIRIPEKRNKEEKIQQVNPTGNQPSE